jgi:hypothetical protein
VPAVGAGALVFEPIVLTPVDRDQLLADVKAFAETSQQSSAGEQTMTATHRLGALVTVERVRVVKYAAAPKQQ